MKKFSLVLALVLVVGSFSMTSCSSKSTKSEEPVISGSSSDAGTAQSANLGSASSGQGR